MLRGVISSITTRDEKEGELGTGPKTEKVSAPCICMNNSLPCGTDSYSKSTGAGLGSSDTPI